MEDNVEKAVVEEEEDVSEEDKYSIEELRNMLGIPSDSIMFSYR